MCRRIGTGHYTKNKIGIVRWAIPFWRVRLAMATNFNLGNHGSERNDGRQHCVKCARCHLAESQ